MKMQIVALRDTVANVYGQPMFVASIGGAIRSFGDQCQGEPTDQNQLAKHPGDFEMWHLGTYDDETGNFTIFAHEDRKQLAHGANYKR